MQCFEKAIYVLVLMIKKKMYSWNPGGCGAYARGRAALEKYRMSEETAKLISKWDGVLKEEIKVFLKL